ncbi:unnamed protein product [Discula destructiva]
MNTFLTVITAFFITVVSSQSAYGDGSGGSSPVISSCPTQFAITSFSASCQRHGTGCQFSFDVATNESLSSPVACSVDFPDVAEELPIVPFTLCTGDRSIVWGWAPVGPPNGSATDYSLIITDAALGLKASKIWDASDFPMTTAGATVYQTFTGDENFDI